MGGCRCTYRNCTVRTDGTTHMFHYPVFDKVRCHQWLTNAQRLDFLNLKVSQLKNRVVCQHHFKEEHFMNFRKEKLKFDAVPTLDGPFCDSSQFDNSKVSQEVSKVYPITLDDIEPEQFTLTDKKANFSVKYGDFLTNCELMDLEPINEISHIKKEIVNKNRCLDEVYLQNNMYDNYQPLYKRVVNPTVPGIQFEKIQLNPVDLNKKEVNEILVTNPISKDKQFSTFTHKPKEMRVKILSEMKISEPVSVKGKLEPVWPPLILRLPDRNNSVRTNKEQGDKIMNTNRNTRRDDTEVVTLNNVLDTKVAVNQFGSESLSTEIQNIQQTQQSKLSPQKNMSNIRSIPNEIAPNKSVLKSKIKQERIDEIKEKRKFNMKLRDIIESCLDKIDEQEKSNDIVSLKEDLNTKQDKNEQVGTFLSKDPELPSVSEYTMACLEARIKKMENVLSNKIDQNSQRIMDLKKTFMTSDKKSACTQTSTNEELHKKHLYKEISKYLSPDANSLIYEELFINKYTQKAPKSSPSPKKRRRR